MKIKTVLITLLAVAAALVLLFFISKYTSAKVVVLRTVNAPIDKVWFVWSNEGSIKEWWGPKDFSATAIENDFRTGGAFLFSMQAKNGVMLSFAGKYKEIIPNQKITASMAFADSSGTLLSAAEIPLPGKWPAEIGLKVEFKDLGTKTQIKVTETGVPLLMYLVAKMQWEQQLSKFALLLK